MNLCKHDRRKESISVGTVDTITFTFRDIRYTAFTGYCEVICLCLLPLLLGLIPSNLMFLSFLISAGLAFSGLSPLFKSGPDKVVHYVSAFISFGAFVIYLILCLNWI